MRSLRELQRKRQRSSAKLRQRVQGQRCTRARETRVDLLHCHALERLYMTARNGLCTTSIAGDKRVDHRIVIVLDLGFGSLHAKAKRDETRHFIEQARERSMQPLVAARGGYSQMKFAIGVEKNIDLRRQRPLRM